MSSISKKGLFPRKVSLNTQDLQLRLKQGTQVIFLNTKIIA